MSGEEFQAHGQGLEKGSVIELVGTVNRRRQRSDGDRLRGGVRQPGEVRLDFGKVDYINSTGIAVIVGVLAMARAEGRDVGAYGLTDHYKEVFEITRLADFMHIYEDAAAGN